MKKYIFILLTIGLYIGCGNSDFEINFCPQSYFTEKFPKRPLNLSRRLGDSILIEISTPKEMVADTLNDSLTIKQVYRTDTFRIGVFYNRHTKCNSLIDLNNNDTIFNGYVSKYRGLFYLTEKKSDSTFWIGALSIDFDSIQGLGTISKQMCNLEEYAENNKQSNIIQKCDAMAGIFEFNADKKLIREIYPVILKKYTKYRIISFQTEYEAYKWQKSEEKVIKTDNYRNVEHEITESVFPNPANDYIQIEFAKNAFYVIELIDNFGRLLYTRKERAENITIPVNEFDAGVYLLRIISQEDKTMETHKIIIK